MRPVLPGARKAPLSRLPEAGVCALHMRRRAGAEPGAARFREGPVSRSLFDRIGGFATVSGIVINFYGKVSESDLVAPYFAATDMKRLIDHQTKFMCSLLGGPASYTDEQIRLVHQGTGITDDAFDEIVELFEESLAEAGIEENEVGEVVERFRSKRDLVVAA
jgi:hemoglobin